MIDLTLKNNKEFYSDLKRLVVPITIQNLVMSSLQLIDNIMIGRLGEMPLASVSLANQLYFVYWMTLFGMNSGCSVFIAQFWGKKDTKSIKKVFGLMILLNVIVSFVYMILGTVFSDFTMNVLSDNPGIISQGKDYLIITSISYICLAFNAPISFGLRNTEETKAPMVISSIAILTNTVLNFGLIYGNFGMPALGVKGAAIATLIARIVESIFYFWYLKKYSSILIGKFHEMFGWSKEFLKKIATTAWPVTLNEFMWGLAFSLCSVIYGRSGPVAYAAVQIGNTARQLLQVISNSIGSAGIVIIGKEVGQNNREKALDIAYKLSICTILAGTVMGIGMIVFKDLFLMFFSLSEEGYSYASNILIIYGVTTWINSFNCLTVVGTLRGGGDTKFSMYMEIGTVWLIRVPLSYIGCIVMNIPIHYVIAICVLEDVVKAIIGFYRVKSKKWINNVVDNM